MSQYKLIAFDMDGTLLNSKKEVSDKSFQAIKKALSLGKTVILNTGRGPAELKVYPELLETVPYLNCISGALVYNQCKKEKIFTQSIPIPTIKEILKIASQEDIMIQILTEESIVQTDKIAQMPRYSIGIYQAMYEQVTTKWDDLPAQYLEHPFPVEKINLYHVNPEARKRTRARIEAAGLSVELVHAEYASLEISAKGVNKGQGLAKLCEHLGISLNETIVVGDADNDIAAFEAAGLSIAMANANDHILSIADVVVADNDHDGCAEAIEQYLL